MNAKKNKKQVVRVNLSHTNYKLVREAAEELGWKVTSSEENNLLYWCDSEGSVEFSRTLLRWQFMNHFPGMWVIAHKVELARNYEKMSLLLPTIFDFHPRTFVLPSQTYDIEKFMSNFTSKSNRTFIIKPDTGSQGRGIIMTQNVEDLEDYMDSAVAQQYISPFLIEGLKFDLRIYVLLTSVDPMRIYIYQEGMARFCTEAYSPPNPRNLDENYAHLTNFSLNKHHPSFRNPETEDDIETAHKRSLTAVFHELRELGVDTGTVWAKIESIVRLSLLSVQPQLSSYYKTAMNVNDGKSRCFEILGFDILLDENQKPWLLEVNCMPSLSASSPFDTHLKSEVIKDTLHVIDLQPDFREKCTERFRKRSMAKPAFASSCKLPSLFDPDRETMLAGQTNWRQLYPLQEKDLALTKVCQMTLNEANMSFNCMNQHAVKFSSSHLGNISVSKIDRSNSATSEKKDGNLNGNGNSRRKQVVIIPKKLERPSTSDPTTREMFLQKKSCRNAKDKTIPFSSTSRPTRASTERKMRVREHEAYRNGRIPKSTPLEFHDLSPMFINEAEERERVKMIRGQMILGNTINLKQKIKIILGKLGPFQDSQAAPQHATKPVSVIPFHFVEPKLEM